MVADIVAGIEEDIEGMAAGINLTELGEGTLKDDVLF